MISSKHNRFRSKCAAVLDQRSTARFVLMLAAMSLLFLSDVVRAQYACNVCQNSPYGSRTLKYPSQVFVMENGKSWQCGQLQEMVQDVQPSANAQEAQHCQTYQIIAEIHGCECNGPQVDSLLDGPFKDVNPSCQLCSGGDLSYVPAYLIDEAINVPNWGVVNCGGMFDAALTGNIFNEENCAEVTPYFREGCCKLPNVNQVGFNNGSSPPPPTPRPTPRPAPAPTPTPASPTTCSKDQSLFQFYLQTDNYPKDTSWTMKRQANSQVVGQAGPFRSASEDYSYSMCLNKSESYAFTLSDSYGDGICCSSGQGSYSGVLEGVPIFSGGNFKKFIQFTFSPFSVVATCPKMSCSSNTHCCSGYTCQNQVCVRQQDSDSDRSRLSTGSGGSAGGGRYLRQGVADTE